MDPSDKRPHSFIQSVKVKVKHRYNISGDQAIRGCPVVAEELNHVSICILVLENGYTLIGKAAPTSSENFNKAMGEHAAYEDALRQLMGLEGYRVHCEISADRK